MLSNDDDDDDDKTVNYVFSILFFSIIDHNSQSRSV